MLSIFDINWHTSYRCVDLHWAFWWSHHQLEWRQGSLTRVQTARPLRATFSISIAMTTNVTTVKAKDRKPRAISLLLCSISSILRPLSIACCRLNWYTRVHTATTSSHEMHSISMPYATLHGVMKGFARALEEVEHVRMPRRLLSFRWGGVPLHSCTLV